MAKRVGNGVGWSLNRAKKMSRALTRRRQPGGRAGREAGRRAEGGRVEKLAGERVWRQVNVVSVPVPQPRAVRHRSRRRTCLRDPASIGRTAHRKLQTGLVELAGRLLILIHG